MKRIDLFWIAFIILFLAVNLLFHLHSLSIWFAYAFFMALIMASAFIERRWINRQPDQLIAEYRTSKIMLIIFFTLTIAVAIPAVFFGNENFWPPCIGFCVLSFETFRQRQKLARRLYERQKSASV
jgi:hypothetical protein